MHVTQNKAKNREERQKTQRHLMSTACGFSAPCPTGTDNAIHTTMSYVSWKKAIIGRQETDTGSLPSPSPRPTAVRRACVRGSDGDCGFGASGGANRFRKTKKRTKLSKTVHYTTKQGHDQHLVSLVKLLRECCNAPILHMRIDCFIIVSMLERQGNHSTTRRVQQRRDTA